MPLTLKPLHPLFVAEATGIDLRAPIGADLAAEIHDAMNRYAVLVFPGQAMDDEQQMNVGRALGTLEATRGVVDAHKHRLKHQEMNDISNLDTDGKLLAADDRRRMFALGNRLWHSDSSFKQTPAMYSMLHARVIPPEGGETEFADMRAAWDALPERTKAKIKSMTTWHSLIYSRAQLGFDEYTAEEKLAFAPVQQRLVRRHPGSGRVSLYLSAHIGRVEGMPVPEGMMMIRDLTEHATQPTFTYRHAWKKNDLVMWDNRCTLHRGRAYDDSVYPRDMRRVTLTDVAPTLEQQAA